MAQNEDVIFHAKMTMAAWKNPYGSVERVFPLAIDGFAQGKTVRYLGIKNVASIPEEIVFRPEKAGYALHTLDKAAYGGRAVDMQLKNPVTGRPMTGSSSGTAMNVFLCFNDLGIGTDGGGSVLAPAMGLNLYGFISPLICSGQMKKYEKRSTDGILFYPSLGLIARSYQVLRHGLEAVLDVAEECSGIGTDEEDEEDARIYRLEKGEILDEKGASIGEAPDLSGSREELIQFLQTYLSKCDCLISREGPVDVNGMGDTMFGHFDEETALCQRKAGKGLIRVANMAGATAMCVPERGLGCGQLLLCQSVPGKIRKLLRAAEGMDEWKDDLIAWYFGNLDQYLVSGAFVPQI